MKLKEKIFYATDAEGTEIDFSAEKDILFFNNKVNTGLKIQDVFRTLFLDEEKGAIYGTSLISYFTPQEDGSLAEPEGNKVSFVITREGFHILLKVTAIERPSLYEDVNINFDYIKAFAELIGITKPDELFFDLLTQEEKEVFATERARKEAEKKGLDNAQAEKERIAKEEQEAANALIQQVEAKKKADDEARAKVNPDYIVEEKKYRSLQKDYEANNFKEYISGDVHFFYNKDWRDYKEEPFVLIKRGDTWFEDVETALHTNDEAITEDDKEVQLEYVDGEERKKVILDLQKGEISVAGTEKTETQPTNS